MKLGEFFIQLGVHSDAKSVKDFARSLGNMSIDAATAVAALVGVEYELTKIAAEAMNASVGFELFRATTGLSWRELQKWQIIGQQVAISSDAINSSISQLQRNLAEIRLGHGNIAPFQMLGIDVRGDAFSVLRQLRERIKGLDRATAVNMISQMGISPEMIKMLELTNAQFEKLSFTVRGMTTEEEQKFYKVRQSLVSFGLVLKQYGVDMVYHLIILLEKFLAYLDSIPGNLKLFAASLGILAAAFFPITSLIIGLLLLLEDLSVYMTGGDSVIGHAIEGFKKLGKEMKDAFSIPGMDALTKLSQIAANSITGGMASPIAQGARSVIQHIAVNVSGAGEPVAVAQEVIRQLGRHTGKAEQHFNNQGH